MIGKMTLIVLGIIFTIQITLAEPHRYRETNYENKNGQTVVENKTITITRTNSPSNTGRGNDVQSVSNYTKTYESKRFH